MQPNLISLMCTALAVMVNPVVSWAQTPLNAPASPLVSLDPAKHKPVLPLAPAELLRLLPKTPDKWELKQSRANNFIMDWVSSQATREFTCPAPVTASVTSGDPPPPPLLLRISLTDTGYYQGLMGDFESPSAAKGGEVEVLTLGGFPARRIALGKTGERLRVLIKERYVIQIDVQNQPANSAQSWFRIFDLPGLAALPVDGEENLPRPFPISRIDELNPRNNSISKVSWATQAEADAAVKRRR